MRMRSSGGVGHFRLLRSALVLLWLGTGCGAVEEPSGPRGPGTTAQEVVSTNTLSVNGLAFNGLAFNGLAFNGLAFNGLASAAFTSWFQSAPALADTVMRYVVRCAVAEGATRTYTDGTRTYTWEGGLGLTPDWASGSPVTQTEQQLLSACLAAHTNKYGIRVAISVLGNTASGQPLPYSSEELTDFSVREGCFFGNLFSGQGVHVGNDGTLFSKGQSSLRACALSAGAVTGDGEDGEGEEEGEGGVCSPIVHIGSCQRYCTRDPSGTYYTWCRFNGVDYRPLTTRIRVQDIFTCGDGVCQPSESCGSEDSASDCASDCGTCP